MWCTSMRDFCRGPRYSVCSVCVCVIGAAERHARVEPRADVDSKKLRVSLIVQRRACGCQEHNEMCYCLVCVVSCS